MVLERRTKRNLPVPDFLGASYCQDKGLPFIKESSMAKLFAADAAMFVPTKAIQIHGGYGYIKEYPLERYFRDARICSIYEGTDEMQRMTIARNLMHAVSSGKIQEPKSKSELLQPVA